jgi:ribonuclease Z
MIQQRRVTAYANTAPTTLGLRRSMPRRATLLFIGTLLCGALSSGASAQTFTVTLLGTGSPQLLPERFGPSILVAAGGEKLLFDVGRGATIRLWQAGVPLRDVTVVFFTHLHSDHVTGFPDLWLTGMLPPKTFANRTERMHVYGPTGTQAMMAHLALAYEADVKIRQADEHTSTEGALISAVDITPGVVYERHGVKVTAFDVDHGDLIKPSFGYRIDYGGHSVVLSGDTRPDENLIRIATGTDVLFHEVAAAVPALLARSDAARRIIGHHTTPEAAGLIFSRVRPAMAVYTHIVPLTTEPDLPPPTLEDIVRATRRTYAGRLEVGEDLMSFEIGDSITVRRVAPGKK